MKYAEARPKIKSGDVLAWTHRTWGSWYDFQIQMIRFFTQSEYSHIGVAYVVGERVFILESVGTGVRQFPLSLEVPFYWMPLDVKWDDKVTAVAMSKMGQKYSYWDGFLSLWKRIKPGEDNQWECAEYVSFLLHHLGINIECRNTPSEDIYWLQENLGAPIYMVTKD